MILSGREIKREIGKGINIEPFNESQLNPNSYNLKLHNELMVYTNPVLDMKTPNPVERLTIPEEGLLLEITMYWGNQVWTRFVFAWKIRSRKKFRPCCSVGRFDSRFLFLDANW